MGYGFSGENNSQALKFANGLFTKDKEVVQAYTEQIGNTLGYADKSLIENH